MKERAITIRPALLAAPFCRLACREDETIRTRQWILRVALAVVIITEMEAAAYGLLRLMEAQAPSYLLPSDAALLAGFELWGRETGFGERWDPLLGWDNQPNSIHPSRDEGDEHDRSFDSDGARSNPLFANQATFVATYGDSFTLGNEVSDEETWQVYLSQRLERYVANHGVSSYGTDQALLKYKVKHEGKPPPPVVVLAISEGNLYRQFYRYRPFSIGGTGAILAFKPMFRVQKDGLRLIDNPAREPPLDRDRFVAALARAKKGDLWYSSRIDIAFPFTLSLVRLAAILSAHHFDLDLWDLGILPKELWRSPEAVRVMRAIVEDFIATAEARGSRAVVLFIPGARTVRDLGEVRPDYAGMLNKLRRDHNSDSALFVDMAETEAEFDRARFNVRPFDGHTSAYGNRIIAEHLAAKMEQRWGRNWVHAAVAPQSR